MSFQPLSIVIPVYNEEDNIINLYDEIIETLKSNSIISYEIVFVDDSSTDNSNQVIKKLLIINNKVKLIHNKLNSGQSFSLCKGIQCANNNTIITLDGDGQNNPNDIINLLNIFKDSNYKLVGGIRRNRKDTYIKIISSKLANKIRKVILNDNCDDTGCGLKIFNKDIFLKFKFFDGIHRFLPALFFAYGHKTFFVEVDHRERSFGTSKYGTFKRLISGIINIVRVRKIINISQKK